MKRSILIFLACMSVLHVSAQVSSPVVNPDNTVTFSLLAPGASKVSVNAQFAPKTDMVKDVNGVWSITLGPVAPDIYPYCFEVDGVSVMDPQCPDWFPNEGFKNSMVDVRAKEPMDHDLKSVPHGKVDYVNYYSETLGLYGNAIVYTPPTYDHNPDKHYLNAPAHHFFGRLLDLRQMLRQAAAGLQIGVKHSPVLLQILSAQFRVLAQMGLRLLGQQQVRDLESVLHPVSHFHAQHSFPVCLYHIPLFLFLQNFAPAAPA